MVNFTKFIVKNLVMYFLNYYDGIWNSHQEIKEAGNDKGEEYETIQPVLEKRALKAINALVDFVLYIGQE